MIIPMRCFTCGKPISHHWEEYKKRSTGGENPAKVLDNLGYSRYCCRRMFISHNDIVDEIMKYRRV
ncbi:DNA-directed RNA polymerase subunit N [uncultured archaeon]|nr:DNA-directed RNA polymerase subunit N [uncultured archaeon]